MGGIAGVRGMGGLGLLAALWLALASTAAAATVTDESGGTESGSFRQTVGAAGDGDTITFADTVQTILLEGAAQSAAEGLTITGRVDTFPAELVALLGQYGIDVSGGTADFSGLTNGIDQQALSNAVDTLTLPGVVLDGGGVIRILDLDAAAGNRHSLTGLTFQNAHQKYQAPEDDRSQVSGGGEAIANAGGFGNPVGYGGGVRLAASGTINNSAFLSNTLTTLGGVAKGENNAVNGSGNANSMALAIGGGASILSDANVMRTLFTNNTVYAEGGASTGGSGISVIASVAASSETMAHTFAYGGGVAMDKGTITASLFQGNTASARGGSAQSGSNISVEHNTPTNSAQVGAYAAADTSAFASGGGAYASSDITLSLFQSNTAVAQGGVATGGSNISAIYESTGGYTYYSVHAEAGALAYALATNGGAYSPSGHVTSSVFLGNIARAQSGTATAGGNAAISTTTNPHGDGTLAYALVSTSANAIAVASGGGMGLDTGTISGSFFKGNMAIAEGGRACAGDTATASGDNLPGTVDASAVALAYASGGGAALMGPDFKVPPLVTSITSSYFIENSVQATGGTLAQAGANASADNVANWANADAYAFGGGVRIGGEVPVTIEDSVFIGNQATATASGQVIQPDAAASRSPEAIAAGGAIFVNTGPATKATNFTLSATLGKTTLISDNTANGKASGIHFGSGDLHPTTFSHSYFEDSTAYMVFTLQADGDVLMYDPVTVEMYRGMDNPGETAAFSMNVDVDAAGRFVWGGNNVMDANGGSTVNFNSGVTTLTADFTLATSDRSATGLDGYRTGSDTDAYARSTETNPGSDAVANPLTVNLDTGATVLLNVFRNSTLAVFDFTKSSTANQDSHFTGSGSIGLDTSRALVSFTGKRFLLADGIGNTDRDTAATGLTGLTGSNYDVSGFDNTQANQLWMTASYDSPYQSILDQWENLENAAPALEQMLSNRYTISDEFFNFVTARLDLVTADQAVERAAAALSTTGLVAGNALRLAFPIHREDDAAAASGVGYMSLAPARRTGLRLWGGYVGAFERMDTHGQHRGYRQTTNGFLTGIARDFASSSIGGYIGYTDSRLRMRGGANGRVDADGYHAGLVGTIMPFREIPALTLSGDFGFAYYDNSSRRGDGVGSIAGDFAQRAWTAAAAASYAVPFGWALATPYASFRWTGIDQNSLGEQGGFTATRVDKASADSFASELGFRLSGDWRMGCVTVSPSAHAAWRHEFGDRDVSASASYNALPGMSYRLTSTARDRDAAVLGACLSARRDLTSGRSIGANLGYSATVGRHAVEHSLSAMLELAF